MGVHSRSHDVMTWAEAVATAVYLRNCIPTAAIKEDKTPYRNNSMEESQTFSNLKVFGCMAYAHIPDAQRQKLDRKSGNLHFVGYSIRSKGCLMKNLKSWL